MEEWIFLLMVYITPSKPGKLEKITRLTNLEYKYDWLFFCIYTMFIQIIFIKLVS